MLRRRDPEGFDARGEREPVVGFDQQMHVRALQADVDDAEVVALERRQDRTARGLVDVALAKETNRLGHTHDDMDRLVLLQGGARLVALARTWTLRGTSRTGTLATAVL